MSTEALAGGNHNCANGSWKSNTACQYVKSYSPNALKQNGVCKLDSNKNGNNSYCADLTIHSGGYSDIYGCNGTPSHSDSYCEVNK